MIETAAAVLSTAREKPTAPTSPAPPEGENPQLILGLPPAKAPRPISPEFIVDAPAPMLKRHKQLTKNARHLYATMRALADGRTGELRIGDRWLRAEEIDFQAEMGRDVRMHSMRELIDVGLVSFERERVLRRIGSRTREVRGRSRYTVHRNPMQRTPRRTGPAQGVLLESISSTVEKIDSQCFSEAPFMKRGAEEKNNHRFHVDPAKPMTTLSPRTVEEKRQTAKTILLERGYDPDPVEIALLQVDNRRKILSSQTPRTPSYFVKSVEELLANDEESTLCRSIADERRRAGIAIDSPLDREEWDPASKCGFVCWVPGGQDMDEDRQRVIVQESAPRWIGVAAVVLAVVSLVALGAGWTAWNRSKALEQSFATDNQQLKQQEDILGQRLAKTEDTNAQLQGKLSVVTGKMKLTEGELGRARRAAAKIQGDNAKQLSDLQNNLNAQLATKAGVDDVKKIGTDVDGVKTDLETTKNDLNMARGEFGTLIAKNHDEIEELRRLGDRDYYEFTINKKRQRERVGDIMVELRGVNTKLNLYSVALYANDARYDKKNRSVNEPIYFFTRGNGHAPLEFVVNQVGKNKISGYLSVLKAQSTHTQTPGN